MGRSTKFLGRICATRGCEAIITDGNQTGYCLRHYRAKVEEVVPKVPSEKRYKPTPNTEFTLIDLVQIKPFSHERSYDLTRSIESLLDKLVLNHPDGHCHWCDKLRHILIQYIQEHK